MRPAGVYLGERGAVHDAPDLLLGLRKRRTLLLHQPSVELNRFTGYAVVRGAPPAVPDV